MTIKRKILALYRGILKRVCMPSRARVSKSIRAYNNDGIRTNIFYQAERGL